MENISTTKASNNTSSSTLVDFPYKSEGIAWCSAFALEAVLILVGNLVTIVLFAVNKKLRKKSLLLVINMAFCDAMVGAVSLPIDILFTGTSYQLWWTGKMQWSLYIFLLIVHTILLLASFTSAAMITVERFYAIYWPLKHRTLSRRVYRIVIFIIWTLAILVSTVVFVSPSNILATYFVVVLCFLFLLFIVCGFNIGIWRKFQHRNMASQQQNRASQNQRLTKTLSFVSLVAFLSWLPIVIYFCIRIGYKVSIPLNIFRVATFLCYSNSFVNPLVYALRIPEFKQALGLCCFRRQTVTIKTDTRALALTPVTQLRTLPTDPSHLQLAFEQEIMDTKL